MTQELPRKSANCSSMPINPRRVTSTRRSRPFSFCEGESHMRNGTVYLVSLLLVFTASGQAQDDDKNFCWKTTYGRGVGAVPTDCPAGKEKDAGLCYTSCPAGQKGVGPVCWSSCPAGFRDDGAFCAKPAAYGRGSGYAIW